MGKKSRKKGGDKAARKEALQSRRREQQSAQPNISRGGGRAAPDFNDDFDYWSRFSNPNKREYFIGDRVWFISWNIDGNNPNTYRGIIKDTTTEGILPRQFRIISLQSIIDGTNACIGVYEDKVFPDFQDFILRFKVGDSVICKCTWWSTAKVSYLWPIFEIPPEGLPVDASSPNEFPHYKCELDFEQTGMVVPFVKAPMDDDGCVKLRPTSFRFKVGDFVDINPFEAEQIGGRSSKLANCETWVKGKVTAVDVSKFETSYAVYECSLVGKDFSCRVVQDKDEYVAMADADPRERLFDAIEQNCSREHLNFLCSHFDIDITLFSKLIVTKAVEHASPQALSWLQYDCDVDVVSMTDDMGNTLLHQIAKSSNATRFIREVGEAVCDAEEEQILEEVLFLHRDLNKRGELWIQSLIERGDVKALDAALSPHYGFAWELCLLSPELIELLKKSVQESRDPMMRCIFDSFLSFRAPYHQFKRHLQRFRLDTEEQLLDNNHEGFWGDDANKSAKVLVRFCRDWCEHSSKKVDDLYYSCARELVLTGSFRLFKLFYEADEDAFRQQIGSIWSKEDRGEYIQSELYDLNNENGDECFKVDVDIFTACIVGSKDHDLKERKEWDDHKIGYYHRIIFDHATSCDRHECPSLHHHLKNFRDEIIDRKDEVSRRENSIFLKRLALLEDDDNFEGRQKILEYLMYKDPCAQIDILQPVKHRQCWALRFMISKSNLQPWTVQLLDSLARNNLNLIKATPNLLFLENRRLNDMTVKCCLCFAAVQYDDLQSLEFLCESHGIPEEVAGGWNLLHFAAYMGRIEIIAWLSSQPAWDVLVAQVCEREPFQYAFAVHIAASEGHLKACDLMIELKVPLEDSTGRLPEDYAKASPHYYVLDWAEKRGTPKRLEAGVKKLLELVRDHAGAVKEMKHFVEYLTCLDVATWLKCGYEDFEHAGPMGYSFGDLLRQCCKSLDEEIVVWLVLRLHFVCVTNNVCDTNDDLYLHQYSRFWISEKQKQMEINIRLRKRYDEKLKEGKLSAELYGDLTKDLPSASEVKKRKKTLTQNELINLVKDQDGYDVLCDVLRKKWFKELSCNDPLAYSILTSVLDVGERLELVRAKILCFNALIEVAWISREKMRETLARGGRTNEIEELISTQYAATDALIREGHDSSTTTCIPWTHKSYGSTTFEPLDMGASLNSVNYDEGHPLRKMMFLSEVDPTSLASIHIVLATEGYAELMRFCMANFSGWTAAMELDVVRIASYFGHSTIAEMFLSEVPGSSLLSSASDRHREAILGAGEALRYRDLEALVERFGAPSDPIIDDLGDEDEEEDQEEGLNASLLAAVLNGYVKETFDRDADNKTSLKTLGFIVNNVGYSPDQVLLSLTLTTGNLTAIADLRVIVDISENVMHMMGLEPMNHHKRLQQLCEAVTDKFFFFIFCNYKEEEFEEVSMSLLQWLGTMADSGIDIQKLSESSQYPLQLLSRSHFLEGLQDLAQKQQSEWSSFAIVTNGGSLNDIQTSVDCGDLKVHARDQGGLFLTHLSAAYDRVDLLEWLVVTKGMRLDSKDGEGRTPFEVAEASKALHALKWITEQNARNTIASFLRRNYHRALQRRRLKRSNNAATIIQRSVRGYSTRKLYSGALSNRLEESKRFHTIWGHLLDSLPGFSSTSWSSIREELLDIKVGIDDDLFDETDKRLKEAMEEAVEEEGREDEDNNVYEENDDTIEDANDDDHDSGINAQVIASTGNEWLSFQMTSHVVKFLQRGDKKYKSFFVRRMQQLARGERSRILKKPLKGSNSQIFETYLEQKSGHRILWTEEEDSIVVWYVAKHKQVSRLMELIDDSKSRSSRQRMPQALANELQNEGSMTNNNESKSEVLLDIVGNVPLKVYDVDFNTISEITKDFWTPQLHLTEEERDIVEAEGTVLVLGRSGTGKTVCICNRIEYDRQSRAGCDPTFTQLFVARSVRLCRYVEGAVGEDHRTSFSTYSRLLNDIESSLSGGHTKSFNPSHNMDFRRFRQEAYTSTASPQVSALILWTVIRTFLKGSIEAFQSPDGILPRDEFLLVERLGKNRCRIPVELREQVYDEFLRYQTYLQEQKLWDDCDRVRHLLVQIKESQEVDPDAFNQVQRSKVYVDEVQDYTQLEILLFFYLCGPNGLFLAGDPAQSVVDGTEFRFEEVRSVGHFVGSVMQKPKTVNINFRSHSGILNCAGGVLDLLFTHFPSSAKQLKKDEGLFQGSRPGVLLGVNVDQLNVLLSDKLKGAAVLTHDESASHWRRRLNDYKRVYGIREAKGLEFKTVIILDFFQEIPPSLQKPWRELVLHRAEQDFEYKHPVVGNMLKLLYTGITRSIEKLFFVETSSSTAGKATIRWLTKKDPAGQGSVATQNNVDDIEAMSMTADEFVGEGINNAELSQSVEDIDEVLLLLERAVWCFEQADNTNLAAKARMQHSSVLFRQELQTLREQDGIQNDAVIEMKACNMMESLCREGLFFEVLHIYYAVKSYLSAYVIEQLERRFISEIMLAEAEDR